MRLSARTEYAAIAAVELARQDRGGPVGTKAICRAQAIPEKFLVQILLQLKRAGLVTSVRGAAGGYRLSRPADTITLRDIELAIEGAADSPTSLATGLAASSRVAASLAAAWEAAAEARSAVLQDVTLADLVARSRGTGGAMYYI